MGFIAPDYIFYPPEGTGEAEGLSVAADPGDGDKDSLKYPIKDRVHDYMVDENEPKNPFELDDPPSIKKEVVYDPETGTYITTETYGNGKQYYAPPSYQSFDEYWEQRENDMRSGHFSQKTGSKGILQGKSIVPDLYLGQELFGDIFGSDKIEIRPTGNIDLILGFKYNRTENPNRNSRNQAPVSPWFDMNINMGVTGKIGDKLKINANFNTKAVFDYQNKIKLEYVGSEDEIIQELRAGDVSFPLPTSLIPGSQNLFGIQSKLKFGRLTMNNVVSQQRSKNRSISLENGSQIQDFEIAADEYDANRHFFLSHYFRDHYEEALSELPYIRSSIVITRLDVYVSDRRGTPNDVQRDIVGFFDMGENVEKRLSSDNVEIINHALPSNQSNTLYADLINAGTSTRSLDEVTQTLENPAGTFAMQDVTDFRKTQARKLEPDEYTYDSQLGFLSLNFALRPDEVLAVAYEYTTIFGGQYRVGEFAEEVFSIDGDSDLRVLYLKMLKSNSQLPAHSSWDLMMKNIYALGAYQVQRQDFELDIYYENPGGGDLRYIPEGKGVAGIPLIRLLNLDRLNKNNEPRPDGVFDFVEAQRDFGGNQQNNFGGGGNNFGSGGFGGSSFGGGGSSQVQNNSMKYGTINTKNGRFIFPVLEPFGDYLKNDIFKVPDENNPETAGKYVYSYLYDSTKVVASQYAELNRYFIRGQYKSSVSSEISLGAFNVPEESVRVYAGGRELISGVDYEINGSIGRIRITNDAYLNAGIPIRVNFEDSGTFGLQQRTMLGSRLDYWISDKFSIGGTFMRLSERPFTQKVNYGEDPIANSMVGMDVNYFTDLPWLTKAIDKLPLLSTKEPSSMTLYAEGAGFLPGHARAIGKDGNVYIDDFDGAKNETPLDQPAMNWVLGSTPKNFIDKDGNPKFLESHLTNDLAYGYNRAKLLWYRIDPYFYGTGGASNSTAGLSAEVLSDHYTRNVPYTEIFPTRQDAFTGLQGALFPLDLTFKPSERGPYNFDTDDAASPYSKGTAHDGSLNDPKSRYGTIMRNLNNTNFEQNNYEFIEFWMMDPYMDNPNSSGGDFYIQLGNVSEDILKDSRQFFENGLPAPSEVANLDTTTWGVVPKIRPVVYAFDNDEESRATQDLGFDGLDTQSEKDFFKPFIDKMYAMNNSGQLDNFAYSNIFDDPCSDDFVHFRSIETAGKTSVVEFYNHFSNPEGNSPVSQGERFTTQSTNLPDTEDLNRDNALNDSENYFQYHVRLEPDNNNFNPNMQVGRNYIEDIRYAPVTLRNQQQDTAKWYYFRIPIDKFSNRVGNVDLRNIQSIRLVYTGFEEDVTCRFATFNLVRNTWRKYDQVILENGETLPDDNTSNDFFNVSAVSIEENSNRIPIPYVLPPGIERVVVTNATTSIAQNERSLAVQVGGLKDGESKGVFKRIDMDMRHFGEMRMFVHAETLSGSAADNASLRNNCDELEDYELNAFIRFGDDFKNNYYEYEIPLKVTQLYSPNDDGSSPYSREAIWPNEMLIKLQDLVDTKLMRNFDSEAGKNKQAAFSRYVYRAAGLDSAKVTVVGSPDLGRVKQALLGVRNPKINAYTKGKAEEDGMPKCAEVWFNELRLSDFDEKAGWAGLARADIKLADLGSVTVSGNIHTPGFGTLEQRVVERYIDNYYDYDVSGNLELGRFFGDNSGIRIPMYAGYSQQVSTPEYDPYDTDILTSTNMDSIRSNFEHIAPDTTKNARKQRQTATTTKSINFTNVRKERTNAKGKPKIYDVSNWAATYAYTEIDSRDPIIESDNEKKHHGSLGYTYSPSPVYWEPFKNIKSKSLYLQLIKDFNFNIIPSSISFRNDIDREVGILKLRPLSVGEVALPPLYDKSFIWNRNYGFRYNPTRSISFDYSANNRAVIDEPQQPEDLLPGTTMRDTIWSNIKRLGRTQLYNQSANLSYNLPLDKFPLLAWTQIRTRYGAEYSWLGNPIEMADTLGNVIENRQNIQINGEFNLTKIYNSIPALKKLDRPNRSRKKTPKKQDKNKDPKSKDKNKDKDAKKATRPPNKMNPIVKGILRPLLSLRRISVTYSQNNSTSVPGFMKTPRYLGMHWNNGTPEPGMDFLFGHQPKLRGWLESAADNDWLSTNAFLNNQVRQSKGNTLTVRANLEPWNDLKIDLNMNLNHTQNHTEFYKIDTTGGYNDYEHLSKIDIGSYSVSYFMLPTLYAPIDTQNIPVTFREFEKNRQIISQELGLIQLNQNGTELGEYYDVANDSIISDFKEGYGPFSQDVLVPAFMAAYKGVKDPRKVNFNPLNLFPLPNWRVTYTGLSKLPVFKAIFSSFNINHAYNSTVTVNNYRNNINFDDRYYDTDIYLDNKGQIIDFITQERLRLAEYPGDLDTLTGNFYTYYTIPQLMVSEQFAPLIGIDASWQNGLTTRFEYKRGRSLAMSFQDYQMSEQRMEEMTIGLGYRLQGFTLPFKFAGKKLTLENDLSFNFDFSIRDNVTWLYRLYPNPDETNADVTSGVKTIQISPSIDYVINSKLRASLFYDYTRTVPWTSQSFPVTNMQGGLRIGFSL